MPSIYDLASQFRNDLLKQDRKAALEMVTIYKAMLDRLDIQIEQLTKRLELARAGGELVNVTWALARKERLIALQRQIQVEFQRFAIDADRLVKEQQIKAQEQGSRDADILLTATTGDKSRTGEIRLIPSTRLARGAIETFVGFTQDGSPLIDLFNEYGPMASERASNTLLTGLTLGWGSRRIAKELKDSLQMPLARALTVTRTETLRAYRTATQNRFEDSGVVEGWVWHASLNPGRTCAICWAMHGTLHKLDEPMASHVNCRCVMIPITSKEDLKGIKKGTDLFGKLTEQQQIETLGKAKFDAWKTGQFNLSDLVQETSHPQWGPGRREKSLNEVVGSSGKPVRNSKKGKSIAKSEITFEPSGTPVSKAFDIKLKGTVKEEVKLAISSIDRVHGDGVLPEIPVKQSHGKYTVGKYAYQTFTGKPVEIAVSSKGNHQALTAVHEIGHFLDHQGMNTDKVGAGKYLSSSKDPLMSKWKDAVTKSEAHRQLTELYQKPFVEYKDSRGETRKAIVDRKYISYLLSSVELWARSYAQYIAVRSRDPKLLEQLNTERVKKEVYYAKQWEDADFEPIMQAMDGIFKELGWMKEVTEDG
jgi:SPP1 gp7 family putative phage head morphogenesis protein